MTREDAIEGLKRWKNTEKKLKTDSLPSFLCVCLNRYTLASRGERSKVMTAEALAEYDADVIVLAPCGFSLDRCVRDAKSILFDEKAEAHGWWTNLRAVQHNR